MSSPAPRIIGTLRARSLLPGHADDFQVADIQVFDSGGTVGCAFGRVGFRSSVWNITVKAAGDVYINTPPLARDLKTSLHASGDWRSGFVSDHGLLTPSGIEYQARTGSRLFDSHIRPAPGAASAPGITTALTIVVVHEDVQPWPNDDTQAGSVRWSEAPDPGQAAMLEILFIPDLSTIEYVLQGVEGIVAALGTRTGESVIVTSQTLAMDEHDQAVVAAARAEVRRQLTNNRVENPSDPTGYTRQLWIRPTAAGHREIWDMALPAE